VLQSFAPPIALSKSNHGHMHDTSQSRRVRGIQLIDQHKAGSLDLFQDGYFGKIHKIWSKLPLELTVKGQKYGWRSIAKKAKGFLNGEMVAA